MDFGGLYLTTEGDADMEYTDFPGELESLKDTLIDIALGPTLEGEHTRPGAMLYHYTNETGMRGILDSGELWATRLTCLEDKGETEYPIDLCRNYLADRQKQEPWVRNRFLVKLIRTMRSSEGIVHSLDEQAAACLSMKTNLSSQWKAYADDGRGYALGFGSHELLNGFISRCKDPNSTKEPNWIPLRMLYERTAQRCILDKLVDTIFDSPDFSDAGPTQIPDPLIALAAYVFGVAAGSFKRPSFSSEHEVRVTVANHRELAIAGTHPPFKCRPKDDRRIEYLQVDVRHPHTGLMPLKEILIGPKLEAEAAQRSIASTIEATDNVEGRAVLVRKVNPDELE